MNIDSARQKTLWEKVEEMNDLLLKSPWDQLGKTTHIKVEGEHSVAEHLINHLKGDENI